MRYGISSNIFSIDLKLLTLTVQILVLFFVPLTNDISTRFGSAQTDRWMTADSVPRQSDRAAPRARIVLSVRCRITSPYAI